LYNFLRNEQMSADVRAALIAARQAWPVLHEYAPEELDAFACSVRDSFQYSVKIHDFLSFLCSPGAPPPAPDPHAHPARNRSPFRSSERLREAIKWAIDPRNARALLPAIDAVLSSASGKKGAEWVIPYFHCVTFPALFNHFSTAPTAACAARFVRRAAGAPGEEEEEEEEEPGAGAPPQPRFVNAVDLTLAFLRSAFSFRQRISDRLFGLLHKKTPAAGILALFGRAVCESLEWLPPTHQSLLWFLHLRDPVRTDQMLARSFCVEIANLMRLSPEYIGNDAIASYSFSDDGRQTVESALLRTLQQLDEFHVGQFCQPIWAFMKASPRPSGRFVAAADLLGSAPEVFYLSDLDAFVLDCICQQGGFGGILGRDAGRPIDCRFECAYQLFELTVAAAAPPAERAISDAELQRRQMHCEAHHYPTDPFECLCDSAEANDLYRLETAWHRKALDALRSRVSTFRQLELDLRTADALVGCLFFQHIERHPVLPESLGASRLQLAVREARRRFFGRLLAVARLDLAALSGSDSQAATIEREFADTAALLATSRQAFVRTLTAKLKALAPAASKRDLADVARRYGRLRQTYDLFEAAVFLQTMSSMRVQLEDVDASAWRVRVPGHVLADGARSVPRQLLAECLARRGRIAERETGAQRLRGHEIVAVAHVAAQLAELGGAAAFAAALETFTAAERQAVVDLVKSAVVTAGKGVAKVGVEFETRFISGLVAIGDWVDVFLHPPQ
jgi:hypothetical protein